MMLPGAALSDVCVFVCVDKELVLSLLSLSCLSSYPQHIELDNLTAINYIPLLTPFFIRWNVLAYACPSGKICIDQATDPYHSDYDIYPYDTRLYMSNTQPHTRLLSRSIIFLYVIFQYLQTCLVLLLLRY